MLDGWLYIVDVIREEGGCIRIVDRLKDIMITAGGKNLAPSEIENAYLRNAKGLQAFVCPAKGVRRTPTHKLISIGSYKEVIDVLTDLQKSRASPAFG